jgi:hypothetical protein
MGQGRRGMEYGFFKRGSGRVDCSWPDLTASVPTLAYTMCPPTQDTCSNVFTQ